MRPPNAPPGLPHHPVPGLRGTAPAYIRTGVRFAVSLHCFAGYPCQQPPPRGVDKGILWAGIGGCVRISGPAPCVAGPGAARATVSGSFRAERPLGGGRAGGAGRGVRRTEAAGMWRAMEESDAGPAPTARVGSGVGGVRPAQARAEVGAGRGPQPHAGPEIAA